MPANILEEIRKDALLEKGSSLIVGVSGGIDSVTLLHLCHAIIGEAAHQNLHLAHVNYGLRGAASDADQDLCESIGEKLGIRCHICDARDSRPESGIQEWARDVRYQFFGDLSKSLSIRNVAVAHNSDDQVETMLHNLFRGAGIRGLSGIRRERVLNGETNLIRPLLTYSRSEVEVYAKANNLEWREDQSNSDEKYTRSWIRGVVLPMLESRYGEGLKGRILNSGRLLSEIEDHLVLPELSVLRKESCKGSAKKGRFEIDVEVLSESPHVLQKQLVLMIVQELNPDLSLNSQLADSLLGLVTLQKGKRFEYGNLLAVREEKSVVIGRSRKSKSEREDVADDLNVEKDLDIGEAILKLRILAREKVVLGSDESKEYIDLEKVSLPLKVRPWKNGDHFKPLGLKGSKNVSDLLTDKKVSNWDKGEVSVVISGEKIVWIPAYGISDEFKLDSESKMALELHYKLK